MSITRKKFEKISQISRLRKICLWLKKYIDERKDFHLDILKKMLSWLKDIDNIAFEVPKDEYSIKILYHKILSLIPDSIFDESILFDKENKDRKVFNIIVILDNIRSPHNVGSIIRTSESFGVSEVLLTGITPTYENSKVKRISMGAQVKTNYFKETEEAIVYAKEKGYKIVCVEKTKESIDYFDFIIEKPCFVFGNEEFGINPEIIKNSEFTIHIPMYGIKNSLNVSVAAGIILSNQVRSFIKV